MGACTQTHTHTHIHIQTLDFFSFFHSIPQSLSLLSFSSSQSAQSITRTNIRRITVIFLFATAIKWAEGISPEETAFTPFVYNMLVSVCVCVCVCYVVRVVIIERNVNKYIFHLCVMCACASTATSKSAAITVAAQKSSRWAALWIRFIPPSPSHVYSVLFYALLFLFCVHAAVCI